MSTSTETAMPAVGELAPDFSLPNQRGESVSLSQFRGQHVVVYFYPKDDTPGCTKEACSFRDHWAALQERKVAVLGISPDGQKSHEKFEAKYALPFQLLSDEDKAVCQAYGVWGEKMMYGKAVVGMKRTTFLVGPDGTVLHVWKKPKTEIHAEEVLAKLG